jgi:rhomboid protease GluP
MDDRDDIDVSGLTPITARSRRQAMDWSLVLASQEIHPIIRESPETGSWMLLVERASYERAMEAIKSYRAENQGWNWRKELPGSDLELHWGVVGWSLFLAFVHWLVTFATPQLAVQGRMDNLLVQKGAWYRLFTAVLLHGDLAHLFANITFGVLILGLAMARFGWGVTLLTTYLAGAVGNVFGLLLYDKPYTGLGASGMMMGALGLLCIHSIGLWRKSPKSARYILSGIIAGFMIFVLFGLDPKSDIIAHFGGFLAGLLAGALLGFIEPKKLEAERINTLCFLLLVAMIVLTWSLAIWN